MRALTYLAPGQRALQEKPRPLIQAPTDAIVRITSTTICGTDLHILKGDVPTVTAGRILGHEGVGVHVPHEVVWPSRISMKGNACVVPIAPENLGGEAAERGAQGQRRRRGNRFRERDFAPPDHRGRLYDILFALEDDNEEINISHLAQRTERGSESELVAIQRRPRVDIADGENSQPTPPPGPATL